MKSGSEMGVGEREGEFEAASSSESEAEGTGDATRDFFILVEVEGRLRGFVDFVPLFVVPFEAFETLGLGGEKEGRLRLGTA